jgi:Zn-dependent M28 family amino/carboxypeptidase
MFTASLITALALTLLQAASPSADGLLEDVRKLSSATSNEGRFDALTAMLRARNVVFTVEPFAIEKPVGAEPRTEGRNVVVTIGTGPEQVVVGAHYDATRLKDGALSVGAVDNAASSVILIHLAEALRGEPLQKRLKIVWFDMEELGLLGSDKYVQAHAGDSIAAMLNFDVNGYGDTVLYGPSERTESASLRGALLQTCAAESRVCIAFPQMPPGDDRSFVKAKVPTLSLATLPALEAHQLWLLGNGGQNSGLASGFAPPILTTIHTPDDTPSKLDGQSMLRTLRFALALVRTVGRS